MRFRVAVEIIEHDDGAVTVQQVYPDGTLDHFYGQYLGFGQSTKLGILLLNSKML